MIVAMLVGRFVILDLAFTIFLGRNAGLNPAFTQAVTNQFDHGATSQCIGTEERMVCIGDL